MRAAIATALDAAASMVRAIEDAITAASADPLEDHATIVALAVTAPDQAGQLTRPFALRRVT